MRVNHRITSKQRRTIRVRKGVRGTAERPRLSVFRSNQHISVQVINDETGKTLTFAADHELKSAKELKITKTEKAKKVVELLIPRMQKLKISKVVFDRGPYRYHGRVRMIAETLRAGGVQV